MHTAVSASSSHAPAVPLCISGLRLTDVSYCGCFLFSSTRSIPLSFESLRQAGQLPPTVSPIPNRPFACSTTTREVSGISAQTSRIASRKSGVKLLCRSRRLSVIVVTCPSCAVKTRSFKAPPNQELFARRRSAHLKRSVLIA